MKKINCALKSLTLVSCLAASSLLFANNLKSNVGIINGGVVQSFSQYPYIVSLKYFGPSGGYYCAGTFIAPQYILTSANCVTDDDGNIMKPTDIIPYYGGINLKKDHFVKLTVDSIQRYPGYIQRTYFNNLAIIKVKQPTVPVKTVTLANPAVLSEGKSVRALGWGVVNYDPDSIEMSPELRYGDQTIASDKALCTYLDNHAPYSCNLYNSKTMIGTFAAKPDGQRTGLGDAGGPVLQLINGVYEQVGVISFAPRLSLNDDNASFSTKISNVSYWKWIQKVIHS